MERVRSYFSEQGEWTHQEREFADRAIRDIGLHAWYELLRVQRNEGNDAFVEATHRIWPDGMPPHASQDEEI